LISYHSILSLLMTHSSHLITVNSANALPKPANKPTETVSKRSLNLEDYKKKRGLI